MYCIFLYLFVEILFIYFRTEVLIEGKAYLRSYSLRFLDINVNFIAGGLRDRARLGREEASPANRKYATHTTKLKN